jgi:hypothetical protein
VSNRDDVRRLRHYRPRRLGPCHRPRAGEAPGSNRPRSWSYPTDGGPLRCLGRRRSKAFVPARCPERCVLGTLIHHAQAARGSHQPDDGAQHACRKDARRGQRLFLVRPVLMRLARSPAHISSRRERRRRIPSASGHLLTFWINRSVIVATTRRRCMGSTCRCDRVGGAGPKGLGHVALEGLAAQPVDLALDPHAPLSPVQHLRPRPERCTRAVISGWPATQRALSPGPGALAAADQGTSFPASGAHERGSLKPHKRSHTAARTGSSTRVPSLSLAPSRSVTRPDQPAAADPDRTIDGHERSRHRPFLRDPYCDGPFTSLTYSRTCFHVTTGLSVGSWAHPPCAELVFLGAPALAS